MFVACNSVNALKVLCRRGADLSLVDADGATALHYAAQLGATHPGDSPRHTAASTAAGLLTLQTILSSGFDPDCRDEDGRTPLMWAATSGNDNTCNITCNTR